MYLKIVCFNQLNWIYFYLLPLRLLLLPLNKNCLSFGDMEFLFSCSIRYLTRSLRSLVRYRFEHSKRNSISPRTHVLLSKKKKQSRDLHSVSSAPADNLVCLNSRTFLDQSLQLVLGTTSLLVKYPFSSKLGPFSWNIPTPHTFRHSCASCIGSL